MKLYSFANFDQYLTSQVQKKTFHTNSFIETEENVAITVWEPVL